MDVKMSPKTTKIGYRKNIKNPCSKIQKK